MYFENLFSNEFLDYIIRKLLYGVTQEGLKCIFMLYMKVDISYKFLFNLW